MKYVFAGSPADGQLRIDEKITGANGKPLSKPTFGNFYGMKLDFGYERSVMDMGNTIGDSESKDGTLSLDVIRGGEITKVEVKIESLGRFSDTFPKNCPKAEQPVTRSMAYLLTHPKERGGIVQEKGVLT